MPEQDDTPQTTFQSDQNFDANIRKMHKDFITGGNTPDDNEPGENIGIDDLRANTEYYNYKIADPQIEYFWKTLQGFSKEEKALFLQFVTGTSKVSFSITMAIK